MFNFLRRNRLADWQRWGLAAGGTLTRLNNDAFDTLAFEYGRDVSQQCLQQWWDVNSPEDLDRTLNWLCYEGHNAECLALCEWARTRPHADSTTAGDDADAQTFYRFVVSQLTALEQHGLVAWDLTRLVNVARWGYTSEYTSDATAWAWIRLGSQKLQSAFESWADVGANFILGYRYWSKGGEAPADMLAAHSWLVTSAGSPWRKIPWSTALS